MWITPFPTPTNNFSNQRKSMTSLNDQTTNPTFKIHDKVRVLKKEEKGWKTFSFGVIVELGSSFAKIWDPKVTDQNLGTIEHSCENFPYESKMLKIIKD